MVKPGVVQRRAELFAIEYAGKALRDRRFRYHGGRGTLENQAASRWTTSLEIELGIIRFDTRDTFYFFFTEREN